MPPPTADLDVLLGSLEPRLNPRAVAFVSCGRGEAAPGALPADDIIGTFRESEGLTLIVDLQAAESLRLPVAFRAAWITLTVHSDLQAVGLTAAFSQALGAAGISCNVVAAVHHDHLFVPLETAGRAMAALADLQRGVRSRERNA